MRRCGIFYYPWYRDRWLLQTPNVMDPPILGQYDNTVYGNVVIQHMRMMRYAGIGFASISWNPLATTYEHVLDAAAAEGVKATIFYESLARATGRGKRVTRDDVPAILDDMRQLKPDLDEDCWLRIDGRPVVMIYVTRNYEDPDHAFGAMREVLGDVYLVGDEIFWKTVTRDRVRHFDAVTSYNWYQPGRFSGATDEEVCDSFRASIRDAMEKNAQVLRGTGVRYWPVAMPGYDDRHVRPEARHPPIPRLDGKFFLDSLNDIKPYINDAYMVNSFDEFYEGSSVEPVRSYGNKYLDIIGRWNNA